MSNLGLFLSVAIWLYSDEDLHSPGGEAEGALLLLFSVPRTEGQRIPVHSSS